MSTAPVPPPRDHPELGAAPIQSQLATAFRSARLHYRGVEQDEADIELLYRIRVDPASGLSADPSWPRPYTRVAAKNFVKILEQNILSVIIELAPSNEQRRLDEEPGTRPKHDISARLAAGRQGQDEPKPIAIGYISLFACFGSGPTQNRIAEMAVMLLPQYQGHGYGAEAIRWILDWAFDMGGLHRVRLETFSWNTQAIRTYEAVGFERVGAEKEVVWRAGRWWDNIIYGVLDRDWQRIKDERKAK